VDSEALAADDLAAAVARTLAVPTVVVTLRGAGCVAHSADTSRHYPAHHVAEVIDSTGASDAFAAALALELTGGGSESDAIHSALSAAAFAIQRPGGHESMPLAADLHAAARH
jgi:ribokinase